MHLVLVGLHSPVIHAGVVVDPCAECAAGGGRRITAGVGERGAEIGARVRPARGGDREGTRTPDEGVVARHVRAAGDVTLIESVGVGAQDVAIAAAVAARAEARGIGTVVPEYDGPVGV